MRRFVVVGRHAVASPEFSLDDVAGTGGRLDVLLRCVRAGLLFSHGVRRDTIVYLCLLGGARAPRTLRFDGAQARFLRPDERALGTLVQKTLGADVDAGPGFVHVRQGVSVAEGELDCVLDDIGAASTYVLEQGGPDVRATALETGDCAFFLGDHLGLDERARARLTVHGAVPLGLGPVEVHSEDAVTVMVNELDRRGGEDLRGRAARPGAGSSRPGAPSPGRDPSGP